MVHGDVGAVGGTNLPDNHFDFCVAANIFFALEHRGEGVAEIKRILKRGGRALIVDWADSYGGLGPHADHIFTVGAARILFEQHGLSYVEEVPAGLYHWGFVVRKKS